MNRLSEMVLKGTATRRLLRGDDEEIGPASHRGVLRRLSTALADGSALPEGARLVALTNLRFAWLIKGPKPRTPVHRAPCQ